MLIKKIEEWKESAEYDRLGEEARGAVIESMQNK